MAFINGIFSVPRCQKDAIYNEMKELENTLKLSENINKNKYQKRQIVVVPLI